MESLERFAGVFKIIVKDDGKIGIIKINYVTKKIYKK